MRESIRISSHDMDFKFRVSGIVIENNKILFVEMDDAGFLCLPGGHVELGEETEQSILRELKEEVRCEFKIDEYFGVIENFFLNKKNRKIHELAFYYKLSPKSELNKNNFTLIENDRGREVKLDFKWIAIEEVDNFDIRPRYLKKILKENNNFNHLIINEL